jgi:hypothetical protein
MHGLLATICILFLVFAKVIPSMSATPHAKQAPADAIEAIVPLMPIVLPIVGGALIFLLAFIAVFMA